MWICNYLSKGNYSGMLYSINYNHASTPSGMAFKASPGAALR